MKRGSGHDSKEPGTNKLKSASAVEYMNAWHEPGKVFWQYPCNHAKSRPIAELSYSPGICSIFFFFLNQVSFSFCQKRSCSFGNNILGTYPVPGVYKMTRSVNSLWKWMTKQVVVDPLASDGFSCFSMQSSSSKAFALASKSYYLTFSTQVPTWIIYSPLFIDPTTLK